MTQSDARDPKEADAAAALASAREQQAAVAAILRSIARSPRDLNAVLDVIATSARRFCSAEDAMVGLVEGDQLISAAHDGPVGFVPGSTPLGRQLPAARCVVDGKAIHIRDMQTEPGEEFQVAREIAVKYGIHTVLATPMFREGKAIGSITLRRNEVRPFTQAQVNLLAIFADQAAIAVENVRLLNATSDGLEQQTAVSEVLKSISASGFDLARVLQTVTEHATRLSGATQGILYRRDGDLLHFAAGFGPSEELMEFNRRNPIAVGNRGTLTGRVAVDKRTIHLTDVLQDPEYTYREAQRLGGFRAMLGVPLMSGEEVLGTLSFWRTEPIPFDDRQIAIVETFARQASVAIQNVRSFTETKEALERQTAIGEILRVMSSSPTDVQPVLDAIAKSASEFCGTPDVLVNLIENGTNQMRAHHGNLEAATSAAPLEGTVAGHAMLERRTVQVRDLQAEKVRYSLGATLSPTTRAILAAPLLRMGQPIGAIILRRSEPTPFTPRQVELAETFADQAAIAIENVRLFNETKEALEQQTATADVLKTISRSAFDLQAVFNVVVENATNLCRGDWGYLFRKEGDRFQLIASHGGTPALLEYERSHPTAVTDHTLIGRVALRRAVVHIPDLFEDPDYDWPSNREHGVHTVLGVPIFRDGEVIGAIGVARNERRPFSDGDIRLVQTFADQATIAMENVRLFNETKESLGQQTALSDVLRTISRSAFDLDAVLQTIVERATALGGSETSLIFGRDGDEAVVLAQFGPVSGGVGRGTRIPVTDTTLVGRALLTGQRQYAADAALDPALPQDGPGIRLSIPLLRDGKAIGVLSATHRERRPFSDRELQMLETFADQAAIAIENVRLFNETKESLERQTALAEILRVIADSPADQQPVVDAIARSATRYCGAEDAAVHLIDGDVLRRVAHHGRLPSAAYRWPVDRTTVAGCSIVDRTVKQVEDLQAAEAEFPLGALQSREDGSHTILAAPLLRKGVPIGALVLRRFEVRTFTPRQVELLRAFADQAVIAIENVRLFNETKEALAQQVAVAQVLQTISNSAFDLTPIFDVILKQSVQLCAADGGWVALRVGADRVKMVALLGRIDDRSRHGDVFDPGSGIAGQVLVASETVHDPKFSTTDYWGRTRLGVPLMREGQVIGVIVLGRDEYERPFTGRQIQLVETLAKQAVIAIENVRLFNETKEALEQQTSISDVLQTIGRSAFDLQPVLDTVVERAVRLCDAHDGSISTLEDGVYRTRSYWSVGMLPPAYIEFMLREVHTPERGSLVGRTALEGRVVQIADVLADPDYAMADMQQAAGYRTVLGVPLLRDGRVIGVFALTRNEVRPFTDRQIELVRTFADQAAIAIENTRLFVATKEALEQQTAVGEVLKTISRSAFDLKPVLDIVLNNAVRLAGADIGWLSRVENDQFNTVAYSSEFPESVREELVRQRRGGHAPGPWVPLGAGGGLMGFTLAEGRTVHLRDVKEDPTLKGSLVARLTASRTVVGVPMLRDGRSIGGMVLARYQVRPFEEREIELVQTFADQAAIAIENVRLFNATKESLERQTAISDVLKTISGTVRDLDPTLQTVVETAARLADADAAWMTQRAGADSYKGGASYGRTEEIQRRLLESESTRAGTGWTMRFLSGRSIMAVAYRDERTVNVPDIEADQEMHDSSATARVVGARSAVAVPVRTENGVVGVMVLARVAVRPFSAGEIELIETFADQAAIAIQNVRLFSEIQDKSDQLEIASRHKSEFLANMSHELRTPLNAIIGFSEVLLQGLFGEINEKQREYLADVLGSGQHLLSLINDILDLSKIEAGRMDLELSTFSFRDALDSGLTIVRDRAARHAIQLNASVAPDVGTLEADERKVKQILYNLLSNAVKFTPDGGRVDVSVRADNGDVRVEVRDTGIGVAPEDQAQIFEEFRQVGRERSREGTGLGLTLTKRFVELHGGRIWLESTPGKGSTFTFTLPLRRAAAVRA